MTVESELRGDIRFATIPILCLTGMAVVPAIQYYRFLRSPNSVWEPDFLLGSYNAFATTSVLWSACAASLLILLLVRIRYGDDRPMRNGMVFTLAVACVVEVVSAVGVLLIFIVSLLGLCEWSHGAIYAFCFFPTAALLSGGIALIEEGTLTGRRGSEVWRASFILIFISVPFAFFIAIFGFLGFGGTS